MDDTEREAIRSAIETAKRQLPKGHKLNHVRWSNGVLQFTSKGPEPERPQGWQTIEFVERPKRRRSRGIIQTEFEL